MKEDLPPPTPQQSRFASRVIPPVAYWAHLTAAVAAMLLVALHLGHANYNVSLAWDVNPEPDIAKYKVYWGVGKRHSNRVVRRRQSDGCDVAEPR